MDEHDGPDLRAQLPKVKPWHRMWVFWLGAVWALVILVAWWDSVAYKTKAVTLFPFSKTSYLEFKQNNGEVMVRTERVGSPSGHSSIMASLSYEQEERTRNPPRKSNRAMLRHIFPTYPGFTLRLRGDFPNWTHMRLQMGYWVIFGIHLLVWLPLLWWQLRRMGQKRRFIAELEAECILPTKGRA